MIKGIIFDFNGVIMVNEYLAIFEDHAKHSGVERDALQKILQDYFDAGNAGEFKNIQEFFEKTKPELGITLEEADEALKYLRYKLRIDLRMVEFIASLKPKYKIAILSNYTSDLEDRLKNLFKIYHLFDLVINSYDIKMMKPDPRIFVHTLDKLNLKPEETIFVDDLEENVRGAEAMGIRGIHYKEFDEFKKELLKVLGAQFHPETGK